MSVTIVPPEAPELATLGNMVVGQAFLDNENCIFIRTDAYNEKHGLVTVMELSTGELFEYDEDASEYQPVKVVAKIVT